MRLKQNNSINIIPYTVRHSMLTVPLQYVLAVVEESLRLTAITSIMYGKFYRKLHFVIYIIFVIICIL